LETILQLWYTNIVLWDGSSDYIKKMKRWGKSIMSIRDKTSLRVLRISNPNESIFIYGLKSICIK